MKVRIKFSKHGAMKFIGHLDIMRYFQKAIRRSDIDIAYSTGFSPHQIMSFAMPLGVGLESDGEYFDVEMNSIVSCEDILTRLNAQMVEGMHILNVRVLPENVGNAMASVAAARYRISFRQGKEPSFPWKEMLADFLGQESIFVIKQTKKSEKELDLRPAIYEMFLESDSIVMLVDASSAGNIKPTLVMEAFYAHASHDQEPLGEFDLEITRMETYANAGTAEAPVFVPLDEI
ncbi:MAG: TIGR03936 family radical SAM-associated protein [Lachnospiraceae bacterium]|nr:TIGR03936 family radical SAM-associated protein [Lachnospiraceae bacterium]